ncbi:MAG: type II toxin-antitoxin system VapC family toxin [Tabrizicola sp.]|jgi:PIN domain nuclease of toxin-antitoxin system|nr:type II toxin-antitoxin system VapC family toxin [Tabrizicola sp.]
MILVDTQILLWALSDDPRLTPRMRDLLQDNDLRFLSAVSIWEIEIKRAVGKLWVDGDIVDIATRTGFTALAITWDHAAEAGRLPPHHADPFDRLLIAQGRLEKLPILTADESFAAYDVALA